MRLMIVGVLVLILATACTSSANYKQVDLPRKTTVEASAPPADNSPSCPQINVPMENGVANVMQGEGDMPSNYGDWTVQQRFQGRYILAPLSPLVCSKGSMAGESPETYYCKNNAQYGIELYLMRKVMDEQGIIREVQRRTFTNVYDDNENYVETLCGKIVVSAS